jgi:hypothetical protein
MFFRSLFYERAVLSLLEEVKQLPLHAQAEIAARVSNYIHEAKTTDEAALNRFVAAAKKEREAMTAAAGRPALAHVAGPALAEAWCVARLGLSEASMDEHCAITIIVAIETFALKSSTA